MKKILLLTTLLFGLMNFSMDAHSVTDDFRPAGDSLKTLLAQRTTVKSALRLEKVMKRGNLLDFYFNACLSDYPWHDGDVKWFRDELKRQFPAQYRKYAIGVIYGGSAPIERIVTSELRDDGKPSSKRLRINDPRGKYVPIVRPADGMKFTKGLEDRHIALWQSHGRYYEAKTMRWEWQRATMLRTVEDMYTQSYVIPFLIPMLENAGAYVMTPRERDIQANEVICDNDPSFAGPRRGLMRKKGSYRETGAWSDAGEGFADAKEIYFDRENPFRMGTARMVQAAQSEKSNYATASWIPQIPKRGEYAVYVSYKTLPNSTDCASYTVRHMGGTSRFSVNQKMGGGMWIYLGTFEFDEGSDGCVTLENTPAEGGKFKKGTVVTADAVKIGGGIGKVARGLDTVGRSDYMTSGLPSFTEGALYAMQWSGMDPELTDDWDDDYTKDYAGRGAWVSYLAGGSRANPDAEGKGIPFDLSFALHTDAGTTPNDSIIGTLSIYTLLCNGEAKLPDGTSRYNCRELADFVQTQIVDDVRKDFEPDWTRRFLWDRSYSESRTTSVPGMLLELLSHQNFADMKYGLDPTFRFTVSRAIYKGMLKYLSNRYGCDYAVQPLPVHSFAADLIKNDKAVELSWLPTEDPSESTAAPKGYILYTRIDGGAFDTGKIIGDTYKKDGRIAAKTEIQPGHVYEFKIVAYNDGGKSFPSEILSAGVHSWADPTRTVLVVNNFDRLSSPAWFDSERFAGFDDALDSGVPYRNEINFIGSMYQFRRELPWMDDDCPGFGASYSDKAGQIVIGNTFDYPSVHGRALLDNGYSFCSASVGAFTEVPALSEGIFAADIICGKQVTTKVGRGAVPDRYRVFPEELQKKLRDFTSGGGHVLISGAHIATDVWDQVFPVDKDSAYVAGTKAFVQEVLGYKWLTNYATAGETVIPLANDMIPYDRSIGFHRLPNDEIYSAENVDGILPACEKARTFLRYDQNFIPAGVCYDAGNYRSVSLGFPIETVKSEDERASLIGAVLKFFEE